MGIRGAKCIIIFLGLLFASCVSNKEFVYLNDQIITLNKRVTGIEESLGQSLQPISSNQAQARVEIDQLKEDIKQISGRVEDNEHLIRRTVEKDLGAQDAVKSDLSNLLPRVEELERVVNQHSGYLNLENIKVQEKAAVDNVEEPGEKETSEKPKARETEQYDLAIVAYKNEKFEQAIDGFKRFIKEFPKSDLADNAQFWIGESYMALKQYEQAILAYQEVIKKYPKENKVPNAMLRQAIAFLEINDKTSSKLLLNKLIKEYPKSSEAEIAKTKLKQL